jgi:hypothetical protein
MPEVTPSIHELKVIIPGLRSSPQSGADGVAQLVPAALIKPRLLAIETQIVQITVSLWQEWQWTHDVDAPEQPCMIGGIVENTGIRLHGDGQQDIYARGPAGTACAAGRA